MSEVLIYSSDWCPYCIRAKQLLTRKGVDFDEVRVDGQPALRAEMTRKAGRTGYCRRRCCSRRRRRPGRRP